MLLPRLLTAVFGIPLIVLAIYWGSIPFFVLMLAIVFQALCEYFYLVKEGKYESQRITGIIIGLLIFVSIFLNGTRFGIQTENQGTPAVLALILAPLFLIELFRSNPRKSIERISVTFFGAFFVAWSLAHIMLIRNIRSLGMNYTYFLFILIWCIDTGAYAAGKKFGKHLLAPVISPKKTIEGALGGVLTGLLTALLLRFIFLKDAMSISESLILGFSIAVIGQFSDLAESLLKRDIGVKDSANLLPGHGGILDRFDSFLFTAPFFYYFLVIIKNG